MRVIVKKEHSNNNKILSLKKRVSAKKELKSTAIEFEDRQAAPGNKALKGVLPVKRVSTPAGGENQPNSVQRGVSEVERKGKIDDETLDLNVGRGGTADSLSFFCTVPLPRELEFFVTPKKRTHIWN